MSQQFADLEKVRAALRVILEDIDRDTWVKLAMGVKKAGMTFDEFDTWSAAGTTYDSKATHAMWKSCKDDGAVGVGTVVSIANNFGLKTRSSLQLQRVSARSTPSKPSPAPGTTPKRSSKDSPDTLWARGLEASKTHHYIASKQAQGVPLDKLRILPADDLLHIAGESMAGALLVPCFRIDGTISSIQCIPAEATAQRLKAAGKPGKLNLPGASLEGFHVVGDLPPDGGRVYITEGIGQAWKCWQATGCAAVVAFGWGRVRKLAQQLRKQCPQAGLVLVPDVGKEIDADTIAAEVGAAVAKMPEGEAQNFDAADLALRDGNDVLADLLEGAAVPPKPEPRYKLMGSADLAALPALLWCVRGVLPEQGLAAIYGPSASGKSFLAFDMAAAVAEGSQWFGRRVRQVPVTYLALEGEAGFRTRVKAWETFNQRALPPALRMVLQPFKLTELGDVLDLAAVIPRGGVVVIDTLNRAAPTADENNSQDMGRILEAAKQLQLMSEGLVVLVHHTGKDPGKGMRGHSSLFAALDAALEVVRNGERRSWSVAKSKDGQDGDSNTFKLRMVELGVDEDDEFITSCVVERDTALQDVVRIKMPQGGNQKLVFEALWPLFKDGRTGRPGAPPVKPCIELEAAITAGAKALTCPTDKRSSRTREAIIGLVNREVLGLHEGWLWLA